MRRSFAYLIALLLSLAAIFGCSGGMLNPQNAAPQIVDASVTPEQMTFRGGNVLLQVTARDDTETVGVTARIVSDGTNEVVELNEQDGGWATEWTAPPNATDDVVAYSVTFAARDAEQLTSAEVQRGFTVGAANVDVLPPPPPPPAPAPPADEA